MAVADDVAELLWQLDHAGERVVCAGKRCARRGAAGVYRNAARRQGSGSGDFTVGSAPRSDTTQRLLIAGAFAVIGEWRDKPAGTDAANPARNRSEILALRAIATLVGAGGLAPEPYPRSDHVRAIAPVPAAIRVVCTLRDIDVALEAVLVMDQFYPWHAVVAVDRYEGNP